MDKHFDLFFSGLDFRNWHHLARAVGYLGIRHSVVFGMPTFWGFAWLHPHIVLADVSSFFVFWCCSWMRRVKTLFFCLGFNRLLGLEALSALNNVCIISMWNSLFLWKHMSTTILSMDIGWLWINNSDDGKIWHNTYAFYLLMHDGTTTAIIYSCFHCLFLVWSFSINFHLSVLFQLNAARGRDYVLLGINLCSFHSCPLLLVAQ